MGCEGVNTTEPLSVQVLIASDDFHVGAPRVPFLIYDGVDTADLASVNVTLVDLSDPENPTAVWVGSATEFADYELAYWTVYPEIPSAGVWGLLVEAKNAKGAVDSYQRTIEVTDAPASPAIGSVPPATQNRTLADTELSLLTSAIDPADALYDQTIADALVSGNRSVIVFATPAFCQTQICTPVVDSTVAVMEQSTSETDFIHVEIYNDFQALTVDPAIDEWNLTSEPWTFVLDEAGAVVARLGGPVSPSEIMGFLENE